MDPSEHLCAVGLSDSCNDNSCRSQRQLACHLTTAPTSPSAIKGTFYQKLQIQQNRWHRGCNNGHEFSSRSGALEPDPFNRFCRSRFLSFRKWATTFGPVFRQSIVSLRTELQRLQSPAPAMDPDLPNSKSLQMTMLFTRLHFTLERSPLIILRVIPHQAVHVIHKKLGTRNEVSVRLR